MALQFRLSIASFGWAALSVLWLVGCGDPGAEAGTQGHVVVLAEGSGESNAEPLWPARPGWLLQPNYGAYGIADSVLDARVVGGRTLLPLGNPVRLGAPLTAGPSEPACARYLALDKAGLWFVGGPREGVLGGGALLVPSTVRVGRKWQTRIGGVPRFTVEVVSRAVEDTVFGRRPVWMLKIVDERAWTYDGTDWAFAKRRNGVVWDLRLVEGRGPDAYNMLTSCRPFEAPALGAGAPDDRFIVVPLDEPPGPPLAAPPVELSPLAPGLVAADYLPWGAGAYPDPRDPAQHVIALRGKWPIFGQYMIGDASAGYTAGGGWSEVPELRCAHFDGTTVTPFAPDEICTTPDAVAVTAAGKFSALPVLWEGSPVRYNVCYGDCGQLVYHEFTGIWQGLDGEPWAIAWGEADTLNVGRYEQDHRVAGTRAFLNNEFSVLAGYAPLHGARTSQLVWPRLQADGALAFVEYSNDHRFPLGRATFVRPGHPEGLLEAHFVYPAIESPSTVVEPGARSHFIFSYDGLLRRVHIVDDGIELEPIAQLRLPNDDLLMAAFVVGQGIVALSQRGYRGFDPWYRPDGFDMAVRPEFGDVYAWRAALPPARAPERPAAFFGVEARVVDQDVRVCWPPGGGTVDLTSFTLAGREPAAAIAYRDCVLLVRQPAPVADLLQRGAWAVEGHIPGGGRAAIALGPSVWQEQAHGHGFEYGFGLTDAAPLTGGGFVTPRMRYGPGLILPQARFGGDESGRSAADLAGHGMWLYRPRWLDHSISLFGPAGETRVDLEPWLAQRYPIPLSGAACAPTCPYDLNPVPVRGGGVLVGTLRIAPDGSVTELPEAWRNADGGLFRPTAGFADGAYCGIRPGGESVCVSAAGAEVVRPELPVGVWAQAVDLQTDNAFWRFSADADGNVTLVRIDRHDLSQREFAVPVTYDELQRDAHGLSATSARYDVAGRLYVLLNGAAGHWLWRIDDAAPTPIDVPELALYEPDQTLGFLVDESLFVFASLVRYADYELESRGLIEQQGVIRVPRAGR